MHLESATPEEGWGRWIKRGEKGANRERERERSGGIKCTRRGRGRKGEGGVTAGKGTRGRHAPSATIHSWKREGGEERTKEGKKRREIDRKMHRKEGERERERCTLKILGTTSRSSCIHLHPFCFFANVFARSNLWARGGGQKEEARFSLFVRCSWSAGASTSRWSASGDDLPDCTGSRARGPGYPFSPPWCIYLYIYIYVCITCESLPTSYVTRCSAALSCKWEKCNRVRTRPVYDVLCGNASGASQAFNSYSMWRPVHARMTLLKRSVQRSLRWHLSFEMNC